MFRLPVRTRLLHQNNSFRTKTTSSSIRSTFIEYFVKGHGHKHVKSSPVVPLCDPTVPFVNAGMNQFKGVFLGTVDPPCPRAVNSQKCIRVGGKHNDLDVVGTDGHHHTFFEMLGNWSFGDYYKKEACQMAWDLLLGPYRLKPENLVVTYFAGDVVIGVTEDRECRDAWKQIGVPPSRLIAKEAADNFWEMGATGPCGPCTEIHYVNPDGSLTEIWNLVFIHCNRGADGKVHGLRRQHVDTGMGLERLVALLQAVPSNYDTDLFRPLIRAIEKNSKGVSAYSGKYGAEAQLDAAYRRLADHARMISVCLADDAFPATSLNLKQIMRKSFKMSSEIFQNPRLLYHLYDEVASTLGDTYPELFSKQHHAKLVLEHEENAYRKMKAGLEKKWKDLAKEYPEVEELSDVEMGGFHLGYKELKEAMAKNKSTTIPGELVFKLYDTHGFQEDLIERVATLNNLEIDKKGFWKLLKEHKSRHKTAFKEQTSNKGQLFDKVIQQLVKDGFKSTNDQFKYDYAIKDNKILFKPLKTSLLAILNENCEWIDFSEPAENRLYYLVTKDTNFYCEEGGQCADSGVIHILKDLVMNIETVFKIRDFVFHKGYFKVNGTLDRFGTQLYVNNRSEVTMEIDSEKRLRVMRNHTGVHLLNAAIRAVLPNTVVCPVGSKVTDKGLSLNLMVYGDKITHDVVLDAQKLIRRSIKANAKLETRIVDSVKVSQESVVTIPGETYPETGLRMVTVDSEETPILSKELCCGTHVPSTGVVGDFCITLVKGAGSHAPVIHALTGDNATQVRELFCHAEKLGQVIELVDPERRKEEVASLKKQLSELCGASGAPYGEYAQCLEFLDGLMKRKVNTDEVALQAIAEAELQVAFETASAEGRRFVVHFVRCSYLMAGLALARALHAAPAPAPALLLGCAGGVVVAAARVPQEMVTSSFSAESWLRCILPVFKADIVPSTESPLLYAEMTGTKVSLINCEQLVQDAMRVAIKFAQSNTTHVDDGSAPEPRKKRQQN